MSAGFTAGKALGLHVPPASGFSAKFAAVKASIVHATNQTLLKAVNALDQ